MPPTMEADFVALSPDAQGISKSAVKAHFSTEKYNRKTDDETEKLIERTWQKRLLENPRIFNGSKFRLHQIEWSEKVPIFCLGLTCYKDYLGTNCSDQVDNLHSRGTEMYNNSQAFMSDALGVGAFVITSDEKFVFLKRSHTCSEAQGLIDGPGGHAEPDMIEGIFNSPSESLSSDLIVNELFDSIIREVVDEVNIPRAHLYEPKLLGITKNFTTGGRMAAEFLINCRLSSDDVAHLFNEGTQSEADESTAILFRSKTEMINALEKENLEMWLEYAPASKARISMYNLLLKK